MNYIVFDLEWNCAANAHSMIINNTRIDNEIIQIGAVKLDEDLYDIDDFSVYVRPRFYTVLNQGVADITNISQSEINAGLPFDKAAEAFLSWCGDDYVFCSWGPCDIDVLKENMRLYNIPTESLPQTIDLQKLYAVQVLGYDSCCSLLNAMDYLGEEPLRAHDALNDADNTVSVMWHLDMSRSDDVEMSIVGCENFLRKDDFKMKYKSISEAISDWSIKAFISPTNGKKAVCGNWVYERDNKYVSVARDALGLEYFIRLEIKHKGPTFRVSRKVYECNESYKEAYESLITFA